MKNGVTPGHTHTLLCGHVTHWVLGVLRCPAEEVADLAAHRDHLLPNRITHPCPRPPTSEVPRQGLGSVSSQILRVTLWKQLDRPLRSRSPGSASFSPCDLVKNLLGSGPQSSHLQCGSNDNIHTRGLLSDSNKGCQTRSQDCHCCHTAVVGHLHVAHSFIHSFLPTLTHSVTPGLLQRM